MSVGFTDKDKGEEYYRELNYTVDESELGKVYYPSVNVEKIGEIEVNYEIKPWISAFEVHGLKPIITEEEMKIRTQ